MLRVAGWMVTWLICTPLLAMGDTVRAAELPTYLIQAQRDAFGAHGFVRRDDPEGRATHAEW